MKKLLIFLTLLAAATTAQAQADSTARTGRVAYYSQEHGYGYIQDNFNEQDYFTMFDLLIDEVEANDRVRFFIIQTTKGPMAAEVQIIEP